MRLFLAVRHGQSLFNVDQVVNGDPALDRGLSEQGIEEAERLRGQVAALPIDLAAVSPFPRALQTANIALGNRGVGSREVPHLVDDDLGDVRIGALEGATLDEYRAAPAHANRKERFPGGESLDEAALRYAGALERLLARDERTILVVCHSLPVSYALGAREGSLPGVRMPMAEHAKPYPFTAEELEAAVRLLEGWAASPTW